MIPLFAWFTQYLSSLLNGTREPTNLSTENGR